MKLRVVSSKKEITSLNRNEQLVHLAFRASNLDVMNLVQSCPRLRAVQIPPSYHETMSKAAQQFLEIQGVQLLREMFGATARTLMSTTPLAKRLWAEYQ